MIHFESSYNSVKLAAIEGAKLVNNVPTGREIQLYQVGQTVKSTDKSPYRFNNCQITGIYKDNGYYRYIVLIDGKKHTFRQKDITLNK